MPDRTAGGLVCGCTALPERLQRMRLLSGRGGGGLPSGTRLASAKSAAMGACTPATHSPGKAAPDASFCAQVRQQHLQIIAH